MNKDQDEKACLWGSSVGAGMERLRESWARSEAWIDQYKRPPLSAYQLAFAEELDDLRAFFELHLGERFPRALTEGLMAALQLAQHELRKEREEHHDCDDAPTDNGTVSFFLPKYLREKGNRGGGYNDGGLAHLRASAAVIMQLLIEEERQKGDQKGANRRAQERIANAISRGGYAVTGRTVYQWWRDARRGKEPIAGMYRTSLSISRHHQRSPLSVIIEKVSANFSRLPIDYGGKERPKKT